MDLNWYPPTSLKGTHWRVELLSVYGLWQWYTEHLTEYDAERFAAYKREYHPHETWRVVKAGKPGHHI